MTPEFIADLISYKLIHMYILTLTVYYSVVKTLDYGGWGCGWELKVLLIPNRYPRFKY